MKFGIPVIIQNKNKGEEPVSININYDGHFISLIKLGLSSVNPELFEALYHTTKPKQFTTALYFPRAKFSKNTIELNEKGEATMYFSVPNDKRNLIFNFYNAFAWLHKESIKRPLEYDSTHIAIFGRIFKVKDTLITLDYQIFKTVSPVVAQNAKHRFISCTDDSNVDEYTESLKSSLRFRYANEKNVLKMVDTLKFEPLETRKVVIKQFKIFVEATVGMFKLEADPRLLNLIQQGGLGSRTGEFCGMIRSI